jgi:hypothetical protein
MPESARRQAFRREPEALAVIHQQFYGFAKSNDIQHTVRVR